MERTAVIDLCYWTTPNGHEIKMLLEAPWLPHRTLPVRIGRGAQFAPDKQLALQAGQGHAFIAGTNSIADKPCSPWAVPRERQRGLFGQDTGSASVDSASCRA